MHTILHLGAEVLFSAVALSAGGFVVATLRSNWAAIGRALGR